MKSNKSLPKEGPDSIKSSTITLMNHNIFIYNISSFQYDDFLNEWQILTELLN